MDVSTFVNQMAEKIEPLQKKLCGLYWKLATTGDPTTASELSESEKQVKIIFSNAGELKQLQQWKSDGIDNPHLARQVELLIKSYIPNQLDEKTISDLVERQTEIENTFNTFRAKFEGKEIGDNDLKDILKKEKNNERRQKAWEATKQIGPIVAEKVKELARQRNKAAQKLGFKNHFEMSLELQELDSAWLFRLFDKLKKETQKTFQKKIGDVHRKLATYYGVAENQVMPWHYEDPFAQAAPSQVTLDLDPFVRDHDILKIAKEFYQSIDLDIADVLERSDLYEKKGKSQHAFCINMDHKGDVRVLANIRPNAYWTSTMLHELGHAAYSKYIDPKLPYFLRDEAHTFTTEAIAMLMERMLHHPHWLQKMVGASKQEMTKMDGALWDAMALDKLVIARWVMVVTHFERALYSNPDQDLNNFWWRLVKEFQLLEKPAGRNTPDWAAKIHISSFPCYYQNYLLGELMAAQIADTLEKEAVKKPMKEVSFLGVPQVGKLLKERLFKMGCQWHWTKLVPHVTGQELSGLSFTKQFC